MTTTHIGTRIYCSKTCSGHILTEENIKRKIDFLIKEIQEKTGAGDNEMDELKKIMDLTNFSNDEN